jgi:hypothetical protein
MEVTVMIRHEELLELESRACFEFFWKEVNTDKNSPGFGLIRDRVPSDGTMASIAAVGFGLTAIVVGVERGWIEYRQGYERTLGTLNTLWNNVEHVNGFYYHFIDINTGRRYRNCEVSNVDTAIAICGALTAAEYFGGEVKERAQQIYERVNWEWFRDPARNQFYMGYSPEKGFEGYWDFYAEQMMMYFLGAASPTYPVNSDMFYSFIRHEATYNNDLSFINSWYGSIFTYQFSHAWFDFKGLVDKDGVDWWQNSVKASIASRQYCIDESKKYKTFGENSWGLTACDGPYGYSGRYGAPPSGSKLMGKYNTHHRNDGTIPTCGAAGSIVFTPVEAINALSYYYENFPQLWGKYGFKDAYNLDVSPAWFAEDYIGIDKGITLLMIENYRTNLVWDIFMKNKYVQLGIERCGLVEDSYVAAKEQVAASVVDG